MSDQRESDQRETVKSLAEQLLRAKIDLQRATSEAQNAADCDARYPIRSKFLEIEIIKMEKQLEKLRQLSVDLKKSHETAPGKRARAVEKIKELSEIVKRLGGIPGVLAEAKATCKDADEQRRQNLDARDDAKENLRVKVREFKAFQTENSKRHDYPENLSAIRKKIREKTEVSAEDKRKLIHWFDVTVVNLELEVEKPLACDDVDDGVWLESAELYYRNIVAALKDRKNKAKTYLNECIMLVDKGVPFSKFGSS